MPAENRKMATRKFHVSHTEWGEHSNNPELIGSAIPDPKEGEDKLVLTRCHAVGIDGDKIIIEAIFEEPAPLVITDIPNMSVLLKKKPAKGDDQ